jgi:hypothetical protein
MADITLVFEEQTPINLVLDGGATYTAGTGISIAGAVITNTAPNIVQTLSIAGQDLTLSNGGGTVAIPAGDNIYNSDGTITDVERYVNLNGNRLKFQAGVLSFQNDSGDDATEFEMADVAINFNTGNSATSQNSSFFCNKDELFLRHSNPSRESHKIAVNDIGILIESNAANWEGMKYDIEYPDILINPRSIPDVGTVNLLKQTPVSYTSAAAPNNCIFYSTTLSKLAYKDPGGTVNPLY